MRGWSDALYITEQHVYDFTTLSKQHNAVIQI
jgi:hypothetical protein